VECDFIVHFSLCLISFLTSAAVARAERRESAVCAAVERPKRELQMASLLHHHQPDGGQPLHPDPEKPPKLPALQAHISQGGRIVVSRRRMTPVIPAGDLVDIQTQLELVLMLKVPSSSGNITESHSKVETFASCDRRNPKARYIVFSKM